MYAKVDRKIIESLRTLFGKDNVLTDPDLLDMYTHDEVPDLKAQPEVVVRARTREQISKLMRFANEKKVPVVPRGSGYGLSGGAVPTCGGIVLSLEKMSKILEIDKDNLMITVEPGVITGKIHEVVEKEGLFYPPDPASLDSCSIGGNIAECAGGPRAIKYGVTKDYVCGLEAVLPSGEIIQLGGKLVKNVTGYDITDLLIGSEGTLAIITKIILRLIPLPRVTVDLLVAFNEFQEAADTVSAIIQHQILPTCIEFMERDSLVTCERHLKKELPLREASAFLLIKLDGNQKGDVEALCESVGEVCFEHNAIDALVAEDRPTQERLWEARRVIIEALKERSPINHMEDIVVPRARINDFLREMRKLQERYQYPIICFGHAGDGNVHVNILKEDRPQEEWERNIPAISKEIFDITLRLGGQITGEHGIGCKRMRYLPRAVDSETLKLFRGIKQLFDPNNILNPGKIFSR